MNDPIGAPVDQDRRETVYVPEELGSTEIEPRKEERHPTSLVVPGLYGSVQIPRPDTHPTLYPRTFALDASRGKQLIMAAANPSDYVMDANGVVRIDVVDWIVLPDVRVSEESGEISVLARTVLFDRDGRHFRTSAAHAPSRLLAAMHLFSAEDWMRGIPFVITRRRGQRGRDYHDIRLGALAGSDTVR